jgi:hypothetical protein
LKTKVFLTRLQKNITDIINDFNTPGNRIKLLNKEIQVSSPENGGQIKVYYCNAWLLWEENKFDNIMSFWYS